MATVDRRASGWGDVTVVHRGDVTVAQHTTQCPYCLDVHTRNAKKAGASREEVAEAAFISAALRAGAAVTHGALALKLFDRAE
jgi:AhpD family alkylhydroperoxidase